jgi:hypothetical protein
VINEVTFNEPSLKDEDGDVGNGWIELKNVSSLSVTTGNLVLILNDSLTWQLPATTVEPEQYLFIWLSGKDRKSNLKNLHASYSIKNIRDNSFYLNNSSTNQTLDSITIYSKLEWSESFARYPDGSAKWLHLNTRTPSGKNESFGIWKKVSSTAPFAPRDGALNPCLFFQEKFWILSGWTGDSANPSKEVWVSEDLRDWELVNPEGPYKGGANFAVFDNKMWAFDGDAYRSEDGVTWQKVASSLPFTENNRITEFKDKLWVVSGDSIFSSLDGINWSLVTGDVPWNERILPGFLAFNDHLWFFGGAEYHQVNHPAYNDVWKSKNGIEWELVTEHASWPGTAWFGFAVFDNKMWLFGGWDYWTYDDVNDVWYSEDGVNWTELESSSIWANRHAPFHWVAHGSLWICSGYNTLHGGLYNDAWRLEPQYLQHQDVFHLKKDNQLHLTSSWSSTEDGLGFPPKGFHYDNQKFIVTSGSEIKLETDWKVDGENSLIVLGDGNDSVSLEIPEGKILAGKIVQDSLSTLILTNASSPFIESASSQSKLVINAPSNHELSSLQAGHFDLLNGTVFLKSPTRVKRSITIGDGEITNPSALHFDPGVILTYNATEQAITHYEFTDNHLAKLVLDCNCKVVIEKDLSIDSLILSSGKIELRQSQLFVNYLEQSDSSSYVIVDDESVLTVNVKDGEAFFPIGTDDSYDPVAVSNASSAVLSAQVYTPEEIECSAFSVNLLWKLFSEEINQDIKVTLQWDSLKEGTMFQKDEAVF